MSRTLQGSPSGAPATQTPADARLSDAYTPVLRRVARTPDLTVRVGRWTRGVAGVEARTGSAVLAPAAWWPSEQLIELDASALGSTFDTDGIDPSKFSHLSKVAPLHGLALHCAAHAAHTVWDFDHIDALPNAVRETVMLFEDVRVEAALLRRRPPDAKWLRAATRLTLRFELMNDQQIEWSAAKVALLTLGRVDAGVLDVADAEPAGRVCSKILGDDRLGEMAKLWRRALNVPDAEQWMLVEIAREWCDLIGVDHDDPLDGEHAARVEVDETGDDETGEPGDGEPSEQCEGGQPGGAGGVDSCSDAGDANADSSSEDGDDAGTGDEADNGDADGDTDDDADGDDADGDDADGDDAAGDGDPRDELRKALDDVGANTERSARDELDDVAEVADAAEAAEQQIRDARKAQAQRRAAEAAQQRADAELADEIFDDDTDDDSAEHSRGSVGHRTAVKSWRAPTSVERGAAAKLARELERDLWRPPSSFVERSTVPPGRLNSRGAVAMSAQIALGKPVTATPWRRTRRVPEPPLELVVGVALDRSGSMSGLVGPTASAAWVIANAMTRIAGRFAAVTFGEECEALTPKHTPPKQVPVLDANAGYEAIGTAIRALDGALSLSQDGAVRLLCIISDGYWVDPAERTSAERQLARLAASGCAVLLCNAGPMEDVRNTRGVQLTGDDDVARVLATEIRAALAAA